MATYPLPREGDRQSDLRKRGYTMSIRGELRTPGGHPVRGDHGTLKADGAKVSSTPRKQF